MSDRGWDAAAEKYDHLWGHGLRAPEEAALWKGVVASVLPPGPLSTIVEVGAGTGVLTECYAGMAASVLATEPSAGMRDIAATKLRRFPHVSVVAADAGLADFGSECADVVIMRYVAWLLSDPETAARRWLDVLKPQGRLILIDQLRLPVSPWRQICRDLADRTPGTRMGASHRVTFQSQPPWKLPYKYARSEGDLRNVLVRAGYERCTASRLEWVDDYERDHMPLLERIGRRWNRYVVTGDRRA